MIDCLSNPAWITPQTDFLLFLQNIRTGHLEAFDRFFLSVTIIGEFWLPTLICAIMYWCVDSRVGTYLFGMEGFNIFMAHFFKMVACVYRPWVLDSRIEPSKLAFPYAKGYSFPSGHTAMSSSVLGGLAFAERKHKFFAIFLICLIFLVGFSRLWLGVHTPQDVLGGLVIGVTLIFVVNFLTEWAEKNRNRYLYLLLITNILAVLALAYVCWFNTYRVDYVGGELLVNPQNQIYVTVIVYGFALGLINGCFLCRRFFPFEPKEVSVKRRILRGVVGGLGTIALMKFILEYIFMNSVNIKIAIFMMFLVGISITLIYPIIFTNLRNLTLFKRVK